jgi:hypothetical protein
MVYSVQPSYPNIDIWSYSRANPDRVDYTLGIITCHYTPCSLSSNSHLNSLQLEPTPWLHKSIIMNYKEEISSLVLDLSDLEVALLLSLAIHEHCLIETTNDCIHDVAKELGLVILYTDCWLLAQHATNTFIDMFECLRSHV